PLSHCLEQLRGLVSGHQAWLDDLLEQVGARMRVPRRELDVVEALTRLKASMSERCVDHGRVVSLDPTGSLLGVAEHLGHQLDERPELGWLPAKCVEGAHRAGTLP